MPEIEIIEGWTYALQVDGHVYLRSPMSGQPYTLVSAMLEARGCGNSKVVRAAVGGGWVDVVRYAGSDSIVMHVGSGRRIARRRVPAAGPAATWAESLYGSQRRKDEFLAALMRSSALVDGVEPPTMTFEQIKQAATVGGVR